MSRNGNTCVWDHQVSGLTRGLFRFKFFEPHSKNHDKGAKIPQIHSKYSKFRIYTSLPLARG